MARTKKTEEVVTDAPLAEAAEGPKYDQWLADIAAAGLSQVEVANADFNGIGVYGHDLKQVGRYTKVSPLTLTLVDGRYVAHPVLQLRSFD